MRTRSITRRRKDPVPWTFEIPLLITVLGVGLLVIGALTGRALAGQLSGTGWVWPDSTALMPTLRGLLSGHPGVAPTWVVYLLVAVVEAMLLAWYAWSLWRVWTDLGPGRRDGLATRAQAAAVLGVGRLRTVRHLIRPDLYRPPRSRRNGPPHRRRPQRSDQPSDPGGTGRSGGIR